MTAITLPSILLLFFAQTFCRTHARPPILLIAHRPAATTSLLPVAYATAVPCSLLARVATASRSPLACAAATPTRIS